MTDNELKKYIERRCDEEPFEVPAFDSFFSEEELAGSVKPHRTVALWPRLAAATAVAAAVALLVMLRPTSSSTFSEPDTAPLNGWIVSEAQSDDVPSAQETTGNVLTAQTTSRVKFQRHHTQEPVVSDATDVISLSDTEILVSESDKEDISSLVENEKPETVIISGQNEVWKENIRIAQQQKKKRREIASLHLAFNCNNSLMTYNSSSESTVSMITRNYQSGSMLRRSSVNRNEWKIPENLNMTRSEIAAYTPVYNLPLTASLGVSFPLGKHWDLRTGLTYTYLSANTYGKMDNNQSFSLYQHLHYLGIPLQFAFNILDNAFGLYVSAGGGLEKGLAGVQYSHVYDKDGEQISSIKLTQSVAGVQPYASFQIGASYRISEHLKVYIEPSLSYYFDTNQPISVRTKRPLYFGLGAGFRFATGK